MRDMTAIAAILLAGMLAAAMLACEIETPAPVATATPAPVSGAAQVPTATRVAAATPAAGATPIPTLPPPANTPASMPAPPATPVPASTPAPAATPTPPPTITPTLSPASNAPPNTSVPAWEALVALYNATGGPNWTYKSNWLSERPLDHWYGVDTAFVSSEIGHVVVGLDLFHNGLTGEIPSELGNLTSLNELDLSGNQLTGEIPSELGNLTSLNELRLGGNRLTGGIPSELGNLAGLNELWLGGNQLTGEIPSELGNLAGLNTLDLTENQLTGLIPPELGNLTGLNALGLSGNQLTGAIPPELGNLTGLAGLWLGGNHLNGCVPNGLREPLDGRHSTYLDLGGLEFCGPKPRLPVDPVTGSELLYFPWQTDGLTWEEQQTLHYLQNIESNHPALARTVRTNFPWLADGVTDRETRRLRDLWYLGKEYPSLAQRFMALPWASDIDVDHHHGVPRRVLFIAYQIALQDPSQAERFLNLPWLNDSNSLSEFNPSYYNPSLKTAVLTYIEHLVKCSNDPKLPRETDTPLGLVGVALGHCTDTTQQPDASLARRILDFSWLADDVTYREVEAISNILPILAWDYKNEIASILDSPLYMGPIGYEKAMAHTGLDAIVRNGEWERLISQPWYQDGLTDEELIRISLAKGYIVKDDEFFQLLLQGDYAVSESFSLPLAGEVDVYVVNAGFTTKESEVWNVMSKNIRTSMELLEDFIGSPWPALHTILYVVPGTREHFTGRIYLDHPLSDSLEHEMAHYYFNANLPHWLLEGTPEFLETYIPRARQGIPLQPYPGVNCGVSEIRNVQDLIEVSDKNRIRANLPGDDGCEYRVGEAFWTGMYLGLGHDAVSSQMHGVYEAALAKNGGNLTEAEIYQVLLSNTPPEKQDEFRELYQRLHGGP